MALNKQGAFSKEPNDLPEVPSNFYSPAEIKAFWQTPSNELKTSFNNLIDALEAPTGAGEIGTETITGVEGDNIQAVLISLKDVIDKVVLGQIPNKSLSISKVDSNFFKQNQLWSGEAYPSASQTITPSKKLSECRNGWILAWSDYDYGVGANSFHWHYTFVPKIAVNNLGSHLETIPYNHSSTGNSILIKTLFYYDNRIEGDDLNNSPDNGSRDVALRRVYEW